jgi:hypothetical protein
LDSTSSSGGSKGNSRSREQQQEAAAGGGSSSSSSSSSRRQQQLQDSTNCVCGDASLQGLCAEHAGSLVLMKCEQQEARRACLRQQFTCLLCCGCGVL